MDEQQDQQQTVREPTTKELLEAFTVAAPVYRTLHRKLEAALADLKAPSGMSPMNLILLRLLDKPKCMSELAGDMGVTLPQVTALANSLLKARFAKSVIAQADRRSRIMSRTPKGAAFLEKVMA